MWLTDNAKKQPYLTLLEAKRKLWGFLRHPLVPYNVRLDVVETYREFLSMQMEETFFQMIPVGPERLQRWLADYDSMHRLLKRRHSFRQTILLSFLSARNAAWIWGGVLVLAVLFYLKLDKEAAQFFAGWQGTEAFDTFETITYLGESFFYIVFSVMAFFLCLNQNRSCASGALYILASIAVSGIIVNAIKPVLSRARPEVFLESGFFGFDLFRMDLFGPMVYQYHSFPSGHSATALSFAFAGIMLWPRLRYVLLVFGVLVAFSRIIVLKHYPGDVIVGSFIGIYTALLLYGLIMGYKSFGAGRHSEGERK